MKKIALILTALVAGASLSAQTPAPAPAPAPAAPAYSITADFTYTTKYVFRGVQAAKGAFQPTLKFTSGDFYASIWGSAPVDKGYELEFDYTAGYGFKVAEGWAADTGLCVYTYPGLGGGADKATYEGFLGLNGSLGVISTGTYVYYDFTLKNFTIQETLGYAIKVDEKTSVNLAATIGSVSPDAGNSSLYYGFGITVPYKLSDAATVTVGAQYADNDIAGLKGSHFWGTLGFTYAF